MDNSMMSPFYWLTVFYDRELEFLQRTIYLASGFRLLNAPSWWAIAMQVIF